MKNYELLLLLLLLLLLIIIIIIVVVVVVVVVVIVHVQTSLCVYVGGWFGNMYMYIINSQLEGSHLRSLEAILPTPSYLYPNELHPEIDPF